MGQIRPLQPTLLGRATAGLVFLSIIATIVSLLVLQSRGAFRETMNVSTTMRSVGDGLPVGADVKLRGVIVGRVASVDPAPGRFQVQLELKPEFAGKIPAQVSARILPTNLFGAPFVDLQPSGAEQPALADGMTIPTDDRANVQMQTVFQKVHDVLVAVEPAKLNVTLSAIADALRGNGERIGKMIERSAAYLSELNGHAGAFRRDLTLLASTLEGVVDAAPDLLASVRNTVRVAHVVAETQSELRTLLLAGAMVTEATGDFVRTNGDRMVKVFDVGADVAEILAPVSPQIERSLVAMGNVAQRLEAALGVGGLGVAIWLTTTQYPTYTPAHCPRYGALAGGNCARTAREARSDGSGPDGLPRRSMRAATEVPR